MKILVMGATGYIGGRLVPLLLEQGHEVRCLSRRPEKLRGVWWAGDCEIVQGDALDPVSLTPAMQGIEAVYYWFTRLEPVAPSRIQIGAPQRAPQMRQPQQV